MGLVADARASGVDVTCEVTPHNLILTEDDAIALGALAKCAPPLRSRAETERLWSLVAAGEVAAGSDHSPSSPELKRGDDAFAAWGGISGVQTLLSLLLSEAIAPGAGTRPHCLDHVWLRCPQVRLAGKGRLEVAADADLALVDLTVLEGRLPAVTSMIAYC